MSERISDLSHVTVVRRSDHAVVNEGVAYYKLLPRADSVFTKKRDLAVVIVENDRQIVYNTRFYQVIPDIFEGSPGKN